MPTDNCSSPEEEESHFVMSHLPQIGSRGAAGEVATWEGYGNERGMMGIKMPRIGGNITNTTILLSLFRARE